jgi:hypothetical protein
MRKFPILAFAFALLGGCDTSITPLPTGTILKANSDSTQGGSSTSSSTDSSSSSDSSSSDTLIAASRAYGPVTISGGSERKIVFYLESDGTLHFLASSDGGVAGTYDRETVWDVDVSCSGTLYEASITKSTIEAGFEDQITSVSSQESTFRIYTVTEATEGIVGGTSGDTLSVSIKAYSEIIANPATAGVFPTTLSDDTTATLVYVGSGSTPLGKLKFRIVQP